MQLLEIKNKEGLCECKTQQTSKRLQKYGVSSFEAIEGVKRAQSGHW
jgi:hypothetical protein